MSEGFMDRSSLLKFWNDAWSEGLWAAAWSKSVAGLTPSQAAWKPADGRHSIWQIVNHMIFWREDALARLKGETRRPTDEELAKYNFAEPAEVSEAAWKTTVGGFERSQQDVAQAIAEPANSVERLAYLLPHDCYHIGQINYVRAMQGLKAIE